MCGKAARTGSGRGARSNMRPHPDPNEPPEGAYADAADVLGSENTSHSRLEDGRYTLGAPMLAIALPVISRKAVTSSSWEQSCRR